MKYNTLLKLRIVTDDQLAAIALKLYDDAPSTFEHALCGTDSLPNSSVVLAKVRSATVAELADVALQVAAKEFDLFEAVLHEDTTPAGKTFPLGIPGDATATFFLTNDQLSEIWKDNSVNKKITRIKLVRQFLNLGLKEAKDLVEQHFLGDATVYNVPYTNKTVAFIDFEVQAIRSLHGQCAIDKILEFTTLAAYEATDLWASHFKY